jgi:hypothetical protein
MPGCMPDCERCDGAFFLRVSLLTCHVATSPMPATSRPARAPGPQRFSPSVCSCTTSDRVCERSVGSTVRSAGWSSSGPFSRVGGRHVSGVRGVWAITTGVNKAKHNTGTTNLRNMAATGSDRSAVEVLRETVRRSAAVKTGVAIVGVTLSLLAGIAAANVTARVLRKRHVQEIAPSISRAAAMRAFDAERALAVSMRMTMSEERDAPVVAMGSLHGSWSTRVEINALECVAVIATAYGNFVPRVMALQAITDDATRMAAGLGEPLTSTDAQGGLVTQVQWCSHEAWPRQAVLELRPLTERVFPTPLTGTVHYAIFRGSWRTVGGITALRRGTPRSSAIRQFPPHYAFEASTAHLPSEGRLVGVPLPLHTESARLIPANEATYRALITRVRGTSLDAVNPRVDPTREPGEPWGTGLPQNLMGTYREILGDVEAVRVHAPVYDNGDGHFRRVLAVIDTDRLQASCAAVVLTRLLYMHGASARKHTTALTDQGTELPSTENVVTDRVCPARGTVIYTVDEHDQEDWLLRVFALPPPPLPVTPSAAPPTDSHEEHTSSRSRRRHHHRH